MYPSVINLYKGNLLGLKAYYDQHLLFVLDCHSNQNYLLFNSLEPSSSIHSLQIYCIRLIGLISHTFWALIVNRDPTLLMSSTTLLGRPLNVCVDFGCYDQFSCNKFLFVFQRNTVLKNNIFKFKY